MKVVRAYTTDHVPPGSDDHERVLVLEDGRAVIVDPLGNDVVVDTELAAIIRVHGLASFDYDLLEQWSDGYPIMSAQDVDAVIEINDQLERMGATMAVSLVPGPDYDACVPEGYIRFVDDLDLYVTVTYAAAVAGLRAVNNPRMILASLQAWRQHPDGAELWFAKDPYARDLMAGRIVAFHPLHGISANDPVGVREIYRVPSREMRQ